MSFQVQAEFYERHPEMARGSRLELVHEETISHEIYQVVRLTCDTGENDPIRFHIHAPGLFLRLDSLKEVQAWLKRWSELG